MGAPINEILFAGLRISTVRSTLLLSLLFIFGNVALLGLVYWQTSSYLVHRIDDSIETMAGSFKDSDPAQAKAQVSYAVTYDLRKSNLYGLFAPDGQELSGNMKTNPLAAITDEKIHQFSYGESRSFGSTTEAQETSGLARAIARRLSNGDILVVGRDFTQMMEIKNIIMRALIISDVVIVAIGLISAFALTIRPLRKINSIREVSRRIVQGELSLRLPICARQDELDMLATIINLMLDEIERLLIEVKGVTDALAHDLRTPLTHLRLQLSHMREQADASMQSSLDGALHELDGLLRRFRGLLRISEIERRQRRSGFVMIDPSDMFNQVTDLFDPLAEDKSITLDVRCEPNRQIFADGDLLFEAICNLVDNAIKFTPAGGSVTVKFSQIGALPRIEVIDTGCGVAAEERAAIMKRQNSHNHEPDQVNRGLGHSIIAAILNLHGFAMNFEATKMGTHISISCMAAATES